MEIIIGIDPSSIATGASIYKYYKSGKLKYQMHYLYTKDAKLLCKTPEYKKATAKRKKELRNLYMEEKITFMCENLLELFSRYKPSAIIIEDENIGTNPSAFKWFNRIQGVVLGYALTNKVKYYFVAPSKWRKIAGIQQTDENGIRLRRPELKAQAMKMVKEELGLDVTDDEADAILIGSIYNSLKTA